MQTDDDNQEMRPRSLKMLKMYFIHGVQPVKTPVDCTHFHAYLNPYNLKIQSADFTMVILLVILFPKFTKYFAKW